MSVALTMGPTDEEEEEPLQIGIEQCTNDNELEKTSVLEQESASVVSYTKNSLRYPRTEPAGIM